MPGNWCYFRVTFNIFLYIVLKPKQIILNLYKTQNQIQNFKKFKQFIIRVIDILIVNYVIILIIISNDILYLMVYIAVAFVV